MNIEFIRPQSWESNCYLLTSGNDAFVVDPGAPAEAIVGRAERLGVVIRAILLTHGHFDHVISLDALRQMTGAPIMIHRDDAQTLTDPMKNAYYSFFSEERSFTAADVLLSDDETLTLGNETLELLHTPGHTPGSVCYLADGFILTGDTLFAEGFGRVDLPGGRLHDMKCSLERLNTLPHSLTIYPGHGEPSSIGEATSKIRFLRR